jgi:DnaJ homolog subfamily C member 7
MAIKRFKAALDDCQAASALQAGAPQVKTLVRLAKCHLAVGSPSASLLTVQQALALDANDSQALEAKRKAEVMQGYLDRFETSKERKDWGQAKWALEKATEECEGDQPIQWRVWKCELDIARKKWDDAIQQAR